MKQPFAQVELRLIRPLFVETSLALLFRQRGTVAAMLSPLEILLKLPIALGHLLLAELVTILLLFQQKQQIRLPVAFTRQSRNAASLWGSRSPARMALMMACPVTPLTSLSTLANWRFICVSAFWIRRICRPALCTRSLRCRQ